MTPSEAVLTRLQLAEAFIRHSRTQKFASVDWRVRAMATLEYHIFRSAPVFTWRHDLLEASISASKDLPSPVTVSSQLMPSPSGFYLFDKAVPMEGCRYHIGGVAWSPMSDGSDYTAVYLYMPTAGTTWTHFGPLATFSNFVVKQGSDVDMIAAGDGAVDIREKSTDDDFEQRAGTRAALRFLVASWLWMKQRVMVPSACEPNSRSQKAACRANVLTAVNVVLLRRSQDRQADSNASEGRDYECQWLVRGHWRQQYYPASGEHRPIWIQPYIKGPEDKPFRAARDTVFAVTR